MVSMVWIIPRDVNALMPGTESPAGMSSHSTPRSGRLNIVP